MKTVTLEEALRMVDRDRLLYDMGIFLVFDTKEDKCTYIENLNKLYSE